MNNIMNYHEIFNNEMVSNPIFVREFAVYNDTEFDIDLKTHTCKNSNFKYRLFFDHKSTDLCLASIPQSSSSMMIKRDEKYKDLIHIKTTISNKINYTTLKFTEKDGLEFEPHTNNIIFGKKRYWITL